MFTAGVVLNASDGAAIYSGDEWTSFALSDMNGDGVVDLILSDNVNRLAVYKNIVSGTSSVANFASTPSYIVDNPTGKIFLLPDRSFDVGDWNGDNFPDVVSGAYCDVINLYMNSGSSSGSAVRLSVGVQILPSQCYNWYPRLYDVNYNGVLDLVSGINWGDLTYWLDPFYLGLDTSDTLSIENSKNNAVDVRSYTDGAILDFGDLNGDCTLDIVIGGHYNDNQIYVAYGPVSTRSCSPTSKPSLYPTNPTIAPTSSKPTIKPSVLPTNQRGSWTSLNCPVINGARAPKLLTDGSVMVISKDPWRLIPDIHGSYINGTWEAMALIPSDYGPVYHASAVLPDGRVVLAGGEYGVNITGAAIYDPVSNSWTIIETPSYCKKIGDSQSVVLADGRWLVGFAWCSGGAILNQTSLNWKKMDFKRHVDGSDEAGYTLLPDGTILSVYHHGEVYDAEHDEWSFAGDGNTLHELVNEIGEIGPQVLRPDGTVFVAGGNGRTSIYDTKTKLWSKGPTFAPSPLGEQPCTLSDAPGALLPNGNVLVTCSGGFYQHGQYQDGPSFWYEFDGVNLNLQDSPTNNGDPSYYYNMLVLPTGQILQTSSGNNVNIYTPSHPTFKDSWRPVITKLPPVICRGGKSLKISGIQMSGMSHGAAYGDDCQTDTNYPLVRITNLNSNLVYYCRTHDHSSVAVQSPLTSSTFFDVPIDVELGPSVLEVVASGINSLPSQINVVSSC